MGEQFDIASIAITALRAMEAAKLAELQQLRLTIDRLEHERKVCTQRKIEAVRVKPDRQIEIPPARQFLGTDDQRINAILSKLSPLMSNERRERIAKTITAIDLLSELRMPCNSRTIDERIKVGVQIVINDLQLLRAAGIVFQEGYGKGVRWKVAA